MKPHSREAGISHTRVLEFHCEAQGIEHVLDPHVAPGAVVEWIVGFLSGPLQVVVAMLVADAVFKADIKPGVILEHEWIDVF
ncbi:MAG: hypothetical protein CFE26_08690 [Verrucomicrobiales bacterium VVV1]|nr:MAG: hypothetical protein CFE26_08690 [Verrucomicrobiales bacterium VVV1]